MSDYHITLSRRALQNSSQSKDGRDVQEKCGHKLLRELPMLGEKPLHIRLICCYEAVIQLRTFERQRPTPYTGRRSWLGFVRNRRLLEGVEILTLVLFIFFDQSRMQATRSNLCKS